LVDNDEEEIEEDEIEGDDATDNDEGDENSDEGDENQDTGLHQKVGDTQLITDTPATDAPAPTPGEPEGQLTITEPTEGEQDDESEDDESEEGQEGNMVEIPLSGEDFQKADPE
jgi:hypothetical protein